MIKQLFYNYSQRATERKAEHTQNWVLLWNYKNASEAFFFLHPAWYTAKATGIQWAVEIFSPICPTSLSWDKSKQLVLLLKRSSFSASTGLHSLISSVNVHVKPLRMTEAFVLQYHQYMDCTLFSVYPSLSLPASSPYPPPSTPSCHFLSP